MIHIDLFSGQGGFSYAADQVWEGTEHIFCDNNAYCQAVLRKFWPNSQIWGDIRELNKAAKMGRIDTNTEAKGCVGNGQVGEECGSVPEERKNKEGFAEREGWDDRTSVFGKHIDILTGGFPCQPFSHAGKRRGKSDDRFLWPEMLECIRLFRPTWIIAENVYGILSIEGGMVFEQVCSDMEKEGYEVWPFIIPACAVNAPHRRDRVWFVAHSTGDRWPRKWKSIKVEEGLQKKPRDERKLVGRPERSHSTALNTDCDGFCGHKESEEVQSFRRTKTTSFSTDSWNQDWKQVAAATCIRGVDDGIPRWMDGVRISKKDHRTERLKMCGNSIVPQDVIEIMKAIKYMDDGVL